MATISLGNFYQNGGKTVVGGSQSGLDTESIINSLVEARRLSATKLETKNTTIDKQLTTYSSLKSLLTRFQTSLDALRNPPGVQNASANIFQYRTATLTTNTGAAASNYVSVTAQPGAAIQNFTIDEISSLARETKQESNSFLLANTTSTSVVGASGSSTANQFAAGTFTLRNVTGGNDMDITLEEGDSLQTVVNKFNDVKSQTGIQANILKVSTGATESTYKIVFSATKTGETYGFDMADSGTVLSDPDGVLSQIGFNTTQAASNATFKVDGVTVTRENNAIADLVDGLTFTLKQTTLAAPGMTLTASIQPDTEIATNAINSFVDIYNEFRVFAAKQQEVGDDGLPTEDAVLSRESLLRSIINDVANEVTRAVNGITGGNPSSVIDIGITFSNFDGDEDNPATKNIMVVDAEKLASALASNFNGVSSLFGFTMTSDNANLTVYKRTNALAASDITLTIDASTNTYKATYVNASNQTVTVDLDATAIASGGVTLKGKNGTALEGLQLIYASDDAATINLKATQGIADRLYNAMDAVLNTSTGTLNSTVTALQEKETRNKTEISKIDTALITYREQLTNQYATLEAALTKANNLLSLLDAQASARESS